MRKFYFSTVLIFSCVFTFGQQQSWLQAHRTIDIANKPSSTPLYQIIGTNIGYGIGDLGQFNGVIPHVRNFNLMENDYPKHLPKEGAPNPNLCDASNAFCNAGNCQEILDPGSGKHGFLSKDWYFQWKNNILFKETYASLEAIFPSVNGNCTKGKALRGYPNKFFTLEEMGGNNMRQNIANYIKNFAETYCPDDPARPCLVNVLELGNEPWGDIPGAEAYKEFMRAAIDGMKLAYNTPNAINGSGWRMKLGAPALEAYTTDPGCGYGDPNQYVEDMLPADIRPFVDYLAVHNYAFGYENRPNGGITDCTISRSPESDAGVYLTVKNMVKWKEEKMPWAKVNITEFGWLSSSGNGTLTGEAGQNAYYMRALLLANRYDINKAFLYSLYDSEAEDLYESTSFFDQAGDLNSARYSLLAVQKLAQSSLSDKKFLKALVEDNNSTNGTMAYLYGDSNGKPTHLVAWRAQEYNSPQNDFPAPSGDYATFALPTSIEVANGSAYFYLNWNDQNDASVSNDNSTAVRISGSESNVLGVKLSGMPVVIPLKDTTCSYDQNGTLVNCESCADPKPVGSPCDDGDSATIDDKILADGCSCQGTVEPTTDDCEVAETEYISCNNNLIFKVSGRKVQIVAQNHPNDLIISVRNDNWSYNQAFCNDYTGACSVGAEIEIPQNILDQNGGTLVLDIQNCNNIPISFNGSTGNSTDADGDGVCEANDCDDNDPTIPAPPGEACDDGDPNTSNDRIKSDGCSCEGTPINVGPCQIELPPTCTPDLICASIEGSILTVDTNGNSFARIDIHRDNYSSVESLCDNWTGGAPECSGVLSSSSLAPGNYLLRVPDANAPNGICWIPFDINSQLAGKSASSAKEAVKLYPNPSTSIVNLDLPEDKKIMKISIFSVQGNKVLEQMGNSRSVKVNNLTKGVYIMRIDGERGSTTKTIIID